jgi:hypothetical protein
MRRRNALRLWFGLLCGLLDSVGWDSQWRKAVSGVPAQLRGSIDWNEQSAAELSWLEYMWLAKARGQSDSFQTVPKSNPKLLLVEILPGVNCQFRFGGSESLTGVQTTSRQMPESSQIDLLQAIDLLQLTIQKLTKIAGRSEVARVTRLQGELPLTTPQTRTNDFSPAEKTKGDIDY